MRRVAVIGPVGAGKTTLANRLGEALSLPVVHLDEVYFRPGPVPDNDETWRAHAELIAAPEWVIDGDYRPTADARFQVADTVVWLDVPRWRCVLHIVRRARNYPAPLRDCLRWTWTYPSHGRHETLTSLERVSGKTDIHHLRSRRDIERFFAHVGARSR